MDEAMAFMNGNDDAIDSLAKRENLKYYNNTIPEEVKQLVESLGGKVKHESETSWDIIFDK